MPALAASSCEIVVIVMVICCADMGFPWREGQSGLCFHQSSFINRCQKKENGIEREREKDQFQSSSAEQNQITKKILNHTIRKIKVQIKGTWNVTGKLNRGFDLSESETDPRRKSQTHRNMALLEECDTGDVTKVQLCCY